MQKIYSTNFQIKKRVAFKMSNQSPSKYKILILNDAKLTELLNTKESSFKIIKLKHPKQNESTPFILVQSENSNSSLNLYELISYTQDMGSIFINDYVQSECMVYFSTKFNLRYFLIDFLSVSNQSDFSSLNEFKEKFLKYILVDPTLDTSVKTIFENCVDTSILKEFCEIKEDTKNFNVMFKMEKCLTWLVQKIDSIKLYIQSNIQSDLVKRDVTKEKIKDDKEKEEAKWKMEAFELVAQFVNKKISESLRKELNLNDTKIVENSNGVKRQCITLN
jgi:hypothetical protein